MTRAIVVGAMLGALLQGQAMANPLCLETKDIREYRAVDGHTIQFWMHDGTKWRSTLGQECPGLAFNGFVIFPANSDSICGNLQTIRVIENHQICRLGPLEKVVATTP